jgi:hypothetical protein
MYLYFMIYKPCFIIFSVLLLFCLSCSNTQNTKPNVVFVNPNANKLNCFKQNKSLDTLKNKDHKILKAYFGSMVTMPARSSLLATQY